MKLVIFDFCETLVNFQTADNFVDYIIDKERYYKFRWVKYLDKILIKTRVMAVVSKFFSELNPSKRLKLFQIRGISNEKVNQYANEFYEERLMPNLISPLYDLFLEHLEKGDYVLIISGGYSPYIKIFADKHEIKGYFATEIDCSQTRISGRFFGKDCLFQQKVVLLDQYLLENKIEYSESIVYSDSSSDLPLLKWANTAFVVSKDKSQPWAGKNGFEEIIHK
jgi:HAD superfamily hydrolase (TIGR01490 family)